MALGAGPTAGLLHGNRPAPGRSGFCRLPSGMNRSVRLEPWLSAGRASAVAAAGAMRLRQRTVVLRRWQSRPHGVARAGDEQGVAMSDTAVPPGWVTRPGKAFNTHIG